MYMESLIWIEASQATSIWHGERQPSILHKDHLLVQIEASNLINTVLIKHIYCQKVFEKLTINTYKLQELGLSFWELFLKEKWFFTT
jgi:hypothetical protein